MSSSRPRSPAPTDAPEATPRLARLARLRRLPHDDNEAPLREPALGGERFDAEAARLAQTHVLAKGFQLGPSPLRARVEDNAERLAEVHAATVQGLRRGEPAPAGADWFLDNFHIIQEQIREIRQDLPAGFDRELPKLEEGPLKGFPRVYAIALSLVAHTDSQLDLDTVKRFLRAYQTVDVLSIGEHWAVVIMLRIALVENLRRLALRMDGARRERAEADALASALLAAAAEGATPRERERRAAAILDAGLTAKKLRRPGYVVRLVQQLRDRDPSLLPAVRVLEDALAAEGRSVDDAVNAEFQRQAALQTTIANVIGTMRLLSQTEWAEFFEETSGVEAILRSDPAGVYPAQDFATRDWARHVVETLGRHDGSREHDAARRALELAQKTPGRSVVHYLVGRGREELERAVGWRPKALEALRRRAARRAGTIYFSSLGVLTAIITAFAVLAVAHVTSSPAWIAAAALFALLPASEAALQLTNFGAALLAPVRRLPKLELKEGVPPELLTLVAVPAMLTSEAEVKELLGDLHVRSLANPDANLRFALLTDLPDADAETLPKDSELVAAARRGIAELNLEHHEVAAATAPGAHPRFWLLHRGRVWNAAEGKWMGWERKRGKLEELNRLLRGEAAGFAVVDADRVDLPRVKYVLTLDADTQLPHGAARRLVGTIAHPLNRPRLEEGRVVEGYGLIQPRISESLLGAQRSQFARILSGRVGIDPYTTTVSDVYQDVFGEASFLGKGIYDVDAFKTALEGRVPENALLSHDLFEGCFVRVGLASDVELYEDHPFSYDVFAKRFHRWVRGDWQLLRWLGRTVPCGGGARRNDLAPLARWKILDNLRRSLVAPAAYLWLALAWAALPGSPLLSSLYLLLLFALPILLDASEALVPPPRGIRFATHARAVLADAGRTAVRVGLTLLFLPFSAVLSVDGMVRALHRQFVSKKKLLDWTSAALAERTRAEGAARYYARMWGSIALVLATAGALVALGAPGLFVALPFLLVWLLAPAVAEEISRTAEPEPTEIAAADRLELREIARRTWRFFEELATQGESFLPPDNLQEDPERKVAHRTSPTNIGFSLLSSISAYDLGWIGAGELVDRIERTLATVESLPRHHGHLFNWYDTQTLRPLTPRYVSTVDSGNLAAALLTVKQTCLALVERVRPADAPLEGLRDVVRLLAKELSGSDAARSRTDALPAARLRAEVASLEERLAQGEADAAFLEDVRRRALHLEDALAAVVEEGAARVAEARFWAGRLAAQAAGALADTGVPSPDRLRGLARRADVLVEEMEFRFLYDGARKLFTVGFNVEIGRADASHYDLLASEARLASFVAIAKGEIESEHWFRMGRSFTRAEDLAALVSWSGSMFEYLMPQLLLPTLPGTLIDHACDAAVRVQMRYGRRLGVPWGVSECAYNARDLDLNYQYGPFGVPALGLKRVQADDVVVAPYATFLALPWAPVAAVENARALAKLGLLGPYGYREAIDSTKRRLPPGATAVVIGAYMAHHQGMSLVSIANALTDGALRERFRAEPAVQATEALLHETVPRHVEELAPAPGPVPARRTVRRADAVPVRRYTATDASHPETHVLSNGSYSVLVTTTGAGWSRRGALDVTRFRDDATREAHGSWIYLRDVRSGVVWSSGLQPVGRKARKYEAVFSEEKIELRRLDAGIQTVTEIVVSAEEDAEIRRVSLTNTSLRSGDVRDVEVTSAAEIVLARAADDAAHPAFQSLFVRSELDRGALLFQRRARSSAERDVFAVHAIAVEGTALGSPQHETDRSRFLGRGRTPAAPAAVAEDRPLSGTVGSVLDPIAALRQRVRLHPGETVRVTFTTAVADSREAALAIADKSRDPQAFDRAASLSWMRAQALLKHLNATNEEAELFQSLGALVAYRSQTLRPRAEVLARNVRQQRNLWAYGISGDLPVVVLKIARDEEAELARPLVKAHEYWRLKGLSLDLVLLNEHPSSYLEPLHDQLHAIVATSLSRPLLDKPGGIFIRRADQMPPEDRVLLETVAHAVLTGGKGTLAEQVERVSDATLPGEAFLPTRAPDPESPAPAADTSDLAFWNGLGGFTADGRAYRVALGEEQWTLTPWINVVANERFGFQVSEAGSGPTFSENSRENRLTPWSNDAVSDPPGEVVYLRDEETGEVWTPTPLPIRERGEYAVTHAHGVTTFRRAAHGLVHEMSVFVPPDDPVKLTRLTLTNTSGRPRRLSITYYVEWVLGVSRAASAAFVVTTRDGDGPLLARNPYNNEFSSRVAWMDAGAGAAQATGDRREFLGRLGDVSRPDALRRARLSGRLGAGIDPCGALKREITLAPRETKEIVLQLGEAGSDAEVLALAARYRDPAAARGALAAATSFWERVLGAVQVKTPDPALDTLLNGWLLYQTLACRVFARSAFYQSSGAYGFRDQLQDVMALVVPLPSVARAQIVRAAGRQFREGDVQHWWHPPTGRGVRTRCSDDLLWLPFVAAHYVAATGDAGVLDESVPFLDAPALAPGQDEAYLEPAVSEESASIYEHGVRAIERALESFGAHGLPLIGAFDWNDGMNRVGHEGKGESVWLGFFLYAVLTRYATLARARGDAEHAARWLARADELKTALSASAWDGDWYLRAFYDDGSPLGSARDEECRIDSIAQTWAVLSGAAELVRAERAMIAVDEHLVRRGEGLVLLFTPPFDRTPRDPGYIKGYLPGVRENGGQYTHAAAWVVMAFAALGDGDRAAETFSILNPIAHTSTRAGVHRYRGEPYVMAGDVYSVAPLTGRAGWTWYTGSAGWMHRAGIESILGLVVSGDHLSVEPCVPRGWPGFEMVFKDGDTRYEIAVENPARVSHGVALVSLDGIDVPDRRVPRARDGRVHRVRVVLGGAPAGETTPAPAVAASL